MFVQVVAADKMSVTVVCPSVMCQGYYTKETFHGDLNSPQFRQVVIEWNTVNGDQNWSKVKNPLYGKVFGYAPVKKSILKGAMSWIRKICA
jgi:hypothetical protein